MMEEMQRTFEPRTNEERQALLDKLQADTKAAQASTRKLEIDNEARELKALEAYAVIVHNSGMFGTNSPEQAGALMLIAKAFGIQPMLANLQFDIIEGKPAMKAVAIMARFQQAGGAIEWDSYTDENVTGTFSHPSCPKPVTIVSSWEDCKGPNGEKIVGFKNKSFVMGREGVKKNWRDSRRQMLRSRCVSEGVRATLPGVLMGLYSPEEVEEITERPVHHAQATRTAPNAMGSLHQMATQAVESTERTLDLDPLAPLESELSQAPTPEAALAIQQRWIADSEESVHGEIRRRTTNRIKALTGK